jgi:uncharacterized protein YoxC
MPNFDSQTILLAFVAVVALAMLLQAIVMLAIYLSLRKAARSIKEKFEDLRDSISPIIDNTRTLVARVAPRVESTADDLAAMAHGMRAQTADIQAAATEILERLRAQTARMDGMISSVFDTLDRASVKAVVESLRNAESKTHTSPAPEDTNSDKDMFV